VREARIAAALSRPNIVRVYDAGESNGRPYIVIEHVDGESLAGRRMSADEATDIALQVCAGLEHAHAHGVVHRDLKPHNLLCRSDGVVKIADFGIARAASQTRITQAGTILGTAEYLGPEQAAGEEVTEKADVYALGATLHELVSGRPPAPGPALSGVPAPLEDAIMRCLARRPDYRPSAAELRRLLQGQAVTRPAAEAPTSVFTRARPRRAWFVTAIAVSAAALVLAPTLALIRDDEQQPARPRLARVQPVPTGTTAAQQARNSTAGSPAPRADTSADSPAS
jgi:serine/threonine protein kinase